MFLFGCTTASQGSCKSCAAADAYDAGCTLCTATECTARDCTTSGADQCGQDELLVGCAAATRGSCVKCATQYPDAGLGTCTSCDSSTCHSRACSTAECLGCAAAHGDGCTACTGGHSSVCTDWDCAVV